MGKGIGHERAELLTSWSLATAEGNPCGEKGGKRSEAAAPNQLGDL